jgi:hypothetical protein
MVCTRADEGTVPMEEDSAFSRDADGNVTAVPGGRG